MRDERALKSKINKTDMLNYMLISLVKILEEWGKKRIRRKIEEASNLISCKELK